MRTIITLAITLTFHFVSVASELFIRVNANGEYYVTVYDQTHQNRNNVYKFSDLPGGITSIMVVNKFNNTILYNGTLSLRNNERIVAEISGFGKLSIIQRLFVQEVNWYTTIVTNDPYTTHSPYPGNPYPGNPYPGGYNPPFPPYGNPNYGSNNTFQLFLNSMKNENIDSNKLRMARNYVSANPLTAEQISSISREFSFDSNRLDFAKYAYTNCYDKNNYFLLKDTFTFASNYNSLLNHIGG